MATAAPITTYSDREFLFRLQTLVIDGGTEVLRNIFDQRLQNQPLNVVLARERSTINQLRRQNTLTTVQYYRLYPGRGQLLTSSDLDITLIVCLLRNLPCLGCNQNYNWNVPPQTGDTSVEADVCRLRGFRNEIAHISSTTGFQQSSFEAKWKEIETVLLRLDQNSPTPNFSQTIDSYKYSPMDPANKQKIRTMIEQWQERDRGLETDMQLIKKDFSDTKKSVKRIEKDLSDTKKYVKRIKKDFSDTQEDVTTVKKAFSDTKKGVKRIKKDFSDTKKGVKRIKKDFSDTKKGVTTIKKDLSDTKEDVKTIKKDFSDTKEDVMTIKKDFSDTKEDVKTIKECVIYVRQGKLIKKDFSDTKKSVKRIEKDLSDTKKYVKRIKKDFSDTQEDVTTVKKAFSDTKKGVKRIKKDFSDTKKGVKRIKKDFSDTKKGVTTIKKDLSDTKEDVKTIKKDFSDTKEDVMTIKKDFSDTKEDVKTIKECVIYVRQAMPSQEETEKVAEKSYVEMKSNLQDDLILFYLDQHKSIPLSPLMEEDQPLLKFYEMPDILSVKVTRSRDGDKQERTLVNTLQDVFYKENKLCSHIYMTADAGYGKTAFSKKLALTWCHAMKPDKSVEKHFSKHEINIMGEFRFVFIVLLRDSSNECDIDKLILNQICSQLAHKHEYSEKNVADILCKEKCLVILDGLDEWTHPENSCGRGVSNIPHQPVRENVAVLTTTRPWKFSVCGLHSSQIDKKLELEKLSDNSAKKLKRSVISHLHGELDESKIDEYETEFNMTVQENHKSDLTGIPLFLMYFLFLWFHKMNVGKSSADLYSSFIELLLSRTVKKETKTETVEGNIPPSVNENTLCKQFYTLLTVLGKLAFYTLFSETKENTLVFDGCIAEKYLSKDEMTFCLKTGIITQSKVQGASLLHQKTKVSFAHKTMQEFLAALYINSATDQKSIQEIMLLKCKCVKNILDMSKIFMFIVSISGEFSLSRELMKIINEDEITQEYRRSLQGGAVYCHFLFSHPLEDLQDMYISCCKEIPRENEVNLCLQDVFIDRRCQKEECHENLKRLTTRNKQNIRSVYINMLHMENPLYDTGRKVIDYFALSDLENIEKICYSRTRDEDIDDVILPWLNSSVTSLYLRCDTSLSCDIFTLQRGSWSRSLSDKVTSLQKLEAIGIRWFKMSHSKLSLLLDFISQRDCLREIDLGRLHCTDHGYSCTGHSLLWGHKPLRRLTLRGLKLSQVIINMASLENCELDGLSNEDLVLEFVNSADNKLNKFRCSGVKSSAAIDETVRVLRESRHVKAVALGRIDLGGRNLTLSPDFVNIEYLMLHEVSMEGSACRELVGSVLKLKHTVTVDIWDCTISPREEFETLKEEIKTSQRVRILKDEKGEFKFETIKDGD